eukprot:scaffold31778_cov56-Phaeocystis_antarctica.AAC.1
MASIHNGASLLGGLRLEVVDLVGHGRLELVDLGAGLVDSLADLQLLVDLGGWECAVRLAQSCVRTVVLVEVARGGRGGVGGGLQLHGGKGGEGAERRSQRRRRRGGR